MEKYLDTCDVADSIKLEMKHPKTKNYIWVIVEGENDRKLYSKFFNEKVRLEESRGGKEKLKEILSKCDTFMDRVIGICDSDLNYFIPSKIEIKNLFYTDFHDAEMTMISCDETFKSLVCEYLFSIIEESNQIRERVLESISLLSLLRFINEKDSLMLNFSGLSFGNFYDGESFKLDIEKCINELNLKSPDKKRIVNETEAHLKYELSKIVKTAEDLYCLCNGHDFEKAFALYINAFNTIKKGINFTEIGNSLRLAYRKESFQATKLYKSLLEWESNHTNKLFS